MPDNQRSLPCLKRLIMPIALAAGVSLALTGCTAISGSKTDTAAFKQRVKNDPFPTAGEAAATRFRLR